MRLILMLAALASLSACATLSARPPTEASIANAATKAVDVETGYALTAEAAAFGAGVFDAMTRQKMARGDRAAFAALTATRATYPPASSLAPADKVRLANAVDRSDEAHEALQAALLSPG